MPNKNMAAIMDANGFSPAAVSRIVRSTKNAASVGTIRPTTKFVTKEAMSDWTPASHGVLIPPFGSGKAIPNEENHVKSGWSVRNTTAQNIHLVKLPPIANVVAPSCRRAMPASSSEIKAAEGASSSSNEMTSFSSCGIGIA